MTIGGINIDGNVFEIALIASMLALLVASFLIGQLFALSGRRNMQLSVDALEKSQADLQAEIQGLLSEKEGIRREGLRAEENVNRWQQIKTDSENLPKMKQELEEFEREESNRIDELERRRAEVAQRLREVQTALDEYPPEITGSEHGWNEQLAKRAKEYDELQKRTEDAQRNYAEADARCVKATDEIARFENRKERLADEVKAAQEQLDRISQGQIDALKPYNERLLEEANELLSQIENLKQDLNESMSNLAATNMAIEQASAELAAKREAVGAVQGASIEFPSEALNVKITEVPDRATAAVSSDEKLSAFRIMPSCLYGFDEVSEEASENDLLAEFQSTLDVRRLQYPPQLVRAFHTALKVNDLSPLTVLSGLSGTGKSQLPRAYARFFGIHFLHVPVEPGWDSPQDILGFYDFVAERYRPTDRARALGHFDREFARDIEIESDRNWHERMLIILLDEMNLARTEYYFSEFLSRLEMRGSRRLPENGYESENDRRDARITIDLPYAEKEPPKHLYVPHNVLWVGTLNEDETTQALSDKVLDRANSIRFAPPNPGTLRAHSNAPDSEITAANGYLPYERWLRWSDRQSAVTENDDQVDTTIENLAKLMQDAGRGFGFRIAQSIKAYIKRYPGQDWRPPMIDQINMRLLPKLAGTELSDCEQTIEEIRRLSEDELGNPEFASALQAAKMASETTQIFTWPGYTYEEETS